MFRLLRYAKKYRVQIILGPLFKLMEAVFELLLPVYMARLVDKGIRANNQTVIMQTAAKMLMMTLIGLVCVLICQYFASYASQGFGTELRKQLLKKINRLSYSELDQFGTATLITRMTNDINQLQTALAMFIRLVIRAPFLSIGSVIMAFYINEKLSLIFLLSLPVFCLILWIIMKKTVPLYKAVQTTLDQFNRLISENLSGVRVIRAFARKDHEIEQTDQKTDELAKAYVRVGNIAALLNPATTLIMNSSIIALLYFSSLQVNTGTMQQGEVLALINYLTQMLMSLIIVANLVIIFTRAAASASRVNEVLNVTPAIDEPVKVRSDLSPRTAGTIHFNQVSFRYNKASGLVLDQLSFAIPAHSTFGIIGPTGSGKSTLIQLIPRFYDTVAGSITLQERSIKELDLTLLRASIGYVPQTSILFSGSIRENLQWGKTNATDEECWQALEIAQSADFVAALPQKLDTPVEAGGQNFSGGQRQRLAIARALIRKPPILILDDSLSALDYQTDWQLRQALKRELQQTTVILVSQRISSVRNADQILVIDDGKQAGLGTHDQLVQTSKVYQAILASQEEEGGETP